MVHDAGAEYIQLSSVPSVLTEPVQHGWFGFATGAQRGAASQHSLERVQGRSDDVIDLEEFGVDSGRWSARSVPESTMFGNLDRIEEEALGDFSRTDADSNGAMSRAGGTTPLGRRPVGLTYGQLTTTHIDRRQLSSRGGSRENLFQLFLLCSQ